MLLVADTSARSLGPGTEGDLFWFVHSVDEGPGTGVRQQDKATIYRRQTHMDSIFVVYVRMRRGVYYMMVDVLIDVIDASHLRTHTRMLAYTGKVAAFQFR